MFYIQLINASLINGCLSVTFPLILSSAERHFKSRWGHCVSYILDAGRDTAEMWKDKHTECRWYTLCTMTSTTRALYYCPSRACPIWSKKNNEKKCWYLREGPENSRLTESTLFFSYQSLNSPSFLQTNINHLSRQGAGWHVHGVPEGFVLLGCVGTDEHRGCGAKKGVTEKSGICLCSFFFFLSAMKSRNKHNVVLVL